MEYCECGSLKLNGNCTNKKCSRHEERHEPASSKQISIILGLLERMGKDDGEHGLKGLTADEAERLIEDLTDELEELKVRKKAAEESEEEEPVEIELEIEEVEDEEFE